MRPPLSSQVLSTASRTVCTQETLSHIVGRPLTGVAHFFATLVSLCVCGCTVRAMCWARLGVCGFDLCMYLR